MCSGQRPDANGDPAPSVYGGAVGCGDAVAWRIACLRPHRPEDPVLGIACVRGNGLMLMEAQHRLFTAVRSDAAVCPPEPHRPEDPVLGIASFRGDVLLPMETQHRLFTAVRQIDHPSH